MTNEKIAIPREVADAIEKVRKTGVTDYRIMEMAEKAITHSHFLAIQRWAFGNGGGTPELLMQALVCGYTIDRSPEEKVREYYEILRTKYDFEESLIAECAVVDTLDLLGIKIEGVNV